MTDLFTIVAIALAVTYIGTRTSYYFFRFFAGACWWWLGVYLLQNPIEAGASPINDIAIVLCFVGGLGVMFWIGWHTNQSGEGRFNIRIPTVFGGTSEEDEARQRLRGSYSSRRENYRQRLNNTIRGRR